MNPFDAPNFQDVVAHHIEGSLGVLVQERDGRKTVHVVLLIDNTKQAGFGRTRTWRQRRPASRKTRARAPD